MADRIVLVHRAEAQRFTLTGVVQARGDTAWTVAGQTIAISETTAIDDRLPMAVGDRVRVEGIIRDDGTLLAESIDAARAPGLPL